MLQEITIHPGSGRPEVQFLLPPEATGENFLIEWTARLNSIIYEAEKATVEILVEAGLLRHKGSWNQPLAGFPILTGSQRTRLQKLWKRVAEEEFWRANPAKLEGALALQDQAPKIAEDGAGWFFKKLQKLQKEAA